MLFNNLSNSRSGESHRHHCAVFGDFVLDFDRGCLQKHGTDLPLRPKSFEVLKYLVTHSGVLVSKEELLDAIWPDVVVTEDSIIQCLIEIRKVLDDSRKDKILTVPRRGYLFDMSVKTVGHHNLEPGNPKQPLFAFRRRVALTGGIALVAAALTIVVWQYDGGSNALSVQANPIATGTEAHSQATQHYEQGRFFHYRRIDGDLDLAISQYRKALAIEPELAKAWVGLGGAYFIKSLSDHSIAPDEYIQYLKKALELEPNNAEANIRISRYYDLQGKKEQAERHLKLALKHGQNDVLIFSKAAGISFFQLKLEDALILQRRAVELDPTSRLHHENLAFFYFVAGRFEEAKAEYRLAGELSSKSTSHMAPSLLQIALAENDLAEAIYWSGLVENITPQSMMAIAMLASVTGDRALAEKNLNWLVAQSTPLAAVKLAEYFAYTGDQQSTFKWLNEVLTRIQERPFDLDARSLLAEANYSPFFEAYRDNEKWLDWKREVARISPPSTYIKITSLVQAD